MLFKGVAVAPVSPGDARYANGGSYPVESPFPVTAEETGDARADITEEQDRWEDQSFVEVHNAGGPHNTGSS